MSQNLSSAAVVIGAFGLQTSKRVFWQTVKAQMKRRITWLFIRPTLFAKFKPKFLGLMYMQILIWKLCLPPLGKGGIEDI